MRSVNYEEKHSHQALSYHLFVISTRTFSHSDHRRLAVYVFTNRSLLSPASPPRSGTDAGPCSPERNNATSRQVLHGHRRDNPLFRPLFIPVNSQVRSPRIPFSPSALFLFPDQIHNNRNYRHSRKASDRNPQADVALISGLWCRADLEGPFHRAQVINARVKDNRMISGSQ